MTSRGVYRPTDVLSSSGYNLNLNQQQRPQTTTTTSPNANGSSGGGGGGLSNLYVVGEGSGASNIHSFASANNNNNNNDFEGSNDQDLINMMTSSQNYGSGAGIPPRRLTSGGGGGGAQSARVITSGLSNGPAAFLRESLIVAAPPPPRSARSGRNFNRSTTTSGGNNNSKSYYGASFAGGGADKSVNNFMMLSQASLYASDQGMSMSMSEMSSGGGQSGSRRPLTSREKRERERQKQKNKRLQQQHLFKEEQERKRRAMLQQQQKQQGGYVTSSSSPNNTNSNNEDDENSLLDQGQLQRIQELLEQQNLSLLDEDGQVNEEAEATLAQKLGIVPNVVSVSGSNNNNNDHHQRQLDGITLKFTSTGAGQHHPLPPRHLFIARNQQQQQQSKFAMFGVGSGVKLREQDLTSPSSIENSPTRQVPATANNDNHNIQNNKHDDNINQQEQPSSHQNIHQQHQYRRAQAPLASGSSAMILSSRKNENDDNNNTRNNNPNHNRHILQTAPTTSTTNYDEEDVFRPKTPPGAEKQQQNQQQSGRFNRSTTISNNNNQQKQAGGGDGGSISGLFSGQSILYSNTLKHSSSNINLKNDSSSGGPLPPSSRRPMTSSNRNNNNNNNRPTDRLAAAVGGSVLIGQQQYHSVTQYQDLLDGKARRHHQQQQHEYQSHLMGGGGEGSSPNSKNYHSAILRATQKNASSSPQQGSFYQPGHNNNDHNQIHARAEQSEMERVAELDPTSEVTPRSHRPQSARLSDLFNSLHGMGEQQTMKNVPASARGSRKGPLFRGGAAMSFNTSSNNNRRNSKNHNDSNRKNSLFSNSTSSRRQSANEDDYQQHGIDEHQHLPPPLGARKIASFSNEQQQQQNTSGQLLSSNASSLLPAASGRPSTASKRGGGNINNSLETSDNNNNLSSPTLPNFLKTASAPTTSQYGKIESNAFDESREKLEHELEDEGPQQYSSKSNNKKHQKRSASGNKSASPPGSRHSNKKSSNNTPIKDTSETLQKFHHQNHTQKQQGKSSSPHKPPSATAVRNSINDTGIDHDKFFGIDTGKVKMHELPGSAFDAYNSHHDQQQQPGTVVDDDKNNNKKNFSESPNFGKMSTNQKSQPFGARVSPAEALAQYDSKLTRFEKLEILEYDDIYFVGQKVFHQKIQAPIDGAVNYGYDDERGEYRTVKGDHVAFRYEVISELGRGSFGQVLKVFDHKRQQHCALKLIRNKKRFQHQARVEITILDHLRSKDVEEKSCTVRMLNFFQFRNHVVITFELHSVNLYELTKLNKHMAFPMQLIRRFAGQILVALSFLHKERIMHADLKPENILLRQENKTGIRVIDFGSSCFEGDASYQYIQSRFYRAPEVILHLPYGRPMDAWSFGTILAEMQLGAPLFCGENEKDQLLCMMEVLGIPPQKMIDKVPPSRRREFFDENGSPKLIPSGKGRVRKPGSTTLKQVLGTSDDLFVDFVAGFLRWDPNERFTPQDGMNHPWIADLFSGRNEREGKVGSNFQSQLVAGNTSSKRK